MNTQHPEAAPAITILIVEDEYTIADNLQRILEAAGYQVTGLAESAAEAMAMATEQPPTIALLDIFLKGPQTGIELAPWLRERGIPFVYLSANLSDSILAAAKQTEPFGFLNKPFREKDVLTTLEIARYRHAHSEEAVLRRRQQVQAAVSQVLISMSDRNQLCQAIAAQIDQLARFSLLNLRIGLSDEAAYYWLMLHKTSAGTFERIGLPDLLGHELPDELQERVAREAPNQLGEQAGVFTGAAFEQLCAQSLTTQASRRRFGIRSLALFPISLKRQVLASIQLASQQPEGFTTAEYEAVSQLVPQIALALDNLLACEEIEARQQQKAAELAVVNAFQNGHDLADIAPQVAVILNELLPLDVLSLYLFSQVPGTPPQEAAVRKTGEAFVPLTQTNQRGWPATPDTVPEWFLQPSLSVGDAPAEAALHHAVPAHYRETLGMQSSLYVPFVIQGELTAVLLVGSQAAYAFGPRDLRMLLELSGQVAMALTNLLAFQRIETLSQQLQREKLFLHEEIIGTSPALLMALRSAGQVAATDYPVLLTGEPGTGKSMLARALHHLSPRQARDLVQVSCTALPAPLLAAELFGPEPAPAFPSTELPGGKLTQARGSTLFLNDIDQLPLELQARLLRELQAQQRPGSSEPPVRLVAASAQDLAQLVAAGRFSPELYHLLSVLPIALPPLRERPEDILPLALHFLRQTSRKLQKAPAKLADAALWQLVHHTWPGNIRELKQTVERAVILASGPTVELPQPLTTPPSAAAPRIKPLEDTMREAILEALAEAKNRIRGPGGAAELLRVKPTTLEARMKKLRISRPEN